MSKLFRGILSEAKQVSTPDKVSLYLEGVCIQTGIINANGRRYDSGLMRDAVNRYKETFLAGDRAYGELGHPDTPHLNLPLVSHRFVSLEQDGSDYIGKCKLNPKTPNGQIAIGLISEGGKLAFSSRGVGSLYQSGTRIEEDTEINRSIPIDVGPDFMLVTPADLVHDASAPKGVLVDAIMESRHWIYAGNVIGEQKIEQMQKTIRSASTRTLDAAKQKVFMDFFSALRKASK